MQQPVGVGARGGGCEGVGGGGVRGLVEYMV